MRFSGGFALVVTCVLAALMSPAFAQESGKKKRADELFEEGRKLLAAGDSNAAAACEKFNEAIKLDPEAPGTMLNLGLCNELLMKYKTALYWFRKAQARAAETGLPDYETAAKEHTVDLKQNKVATIKIAFSSTPPDGTKVKIDNEEVAPADYLAAEVDPGDHTLVAGAPGKKIVTQTFTVEGRGGQVITIEFVAGDNTTIVDPGAGRRKIAYITAAAGGALLLGSLAISAYAATQYGKCADNGNLHSADELVTEGCPQDVINAGEGAQIAFANKYQEMAQNWGTSLFIAGAVTVTVAAVLYFTAPDKERIDRTVFTPTLGPNEVGFAVSGGF